MLRINLKHALVTVAVASGLLSTAGPASATTQHHQSDLEFLAPCAGVKDGTSNTIAFGERTAAPRGFPIDVGASESLAPDRPGADFILMADMGGQFY